MKITNIMQGEIRKDSIKKNEVDGSLSFVVRAAKVGVREYWYEDSFGDPLVMKEALLPEHLFNEDTMKSLKGVIITDYHPWCFVNPENWDYYAKGFTIGEPFIEDNTYLCTEVKVMDKTMQAFILSDMKTGCSIGYEQVFVAEPGEFNGEKYDGYNTQIKINHLAMVARDDARGGEDLGVISEIKMDSKVYQEFIKYRRDSKNRFTGGENMPKIEVRIDGATIALPTECGEVVKKHLDSLEAKVAKIPELEKNLQEAQGRVDSVTKELEDKKKELETATAKCDSLEADVASKDAQIKELQTRVDGKPDEEAVLSRFKLAQKVAEITGEEADFRADARDLRIKALTALYPDQDFSNHTDTYLEARLDLAMEHFDSNGYPTIVKKEEKNPKEQHMDSTTVVDAEGRCSNHFSMNK